MDNCEICTYEQDAMMNIVIMSKHRAGKLPHFVGRISVDHVGD